MRVSRTKVSRSFCQWTLKPAIRTTGDAEISPKPVRDTDRHHTKSSRLGISSTSIFQRLHDARQPLRLWSFFSSSAWAWQTLYGHRKKSGLARILGTARTVCLSFASLLTICNGVISNFRPAANTVGTPAKGWYRFFTRWCNRKGKKENQTPNITF